MRWRLTGSYGTFVITKVVEADTEDEAFEQTGIMVDLIAVGWTVVESPDGEEWEVEPL